MSANVKNGPPPIQVGYILSHGYSGSTLLDLILGAQPGVVSVGEIKHFANYYIDDKQCSCKKNVRDCYYWSKVIDLSEDLFFQYFGLENYVYHLENVNYSFREDYRKSLITSGFDSLLELQGVQNYLKINYALFKAISTIGQAELIIDSSKDPARAAILYYSDLFDVKIIHLYRDHRSYLESKKRKSQDPNRESMHWPGPFIHTLKLWKGTIHHKLFLSKVKAEDKIALDYHKLATNPMESVQKLSKFLDTKYNHKTLLPESKEFFSRYPVHNIGGNRLRLSPVNDIQYLCRWPNNLSMLEKTIFLLLGGRILNKLSNWKEDAI